MNVEEQEKGTQDASTTARLFVTNHFDEYVLSGLI
jgi:hypothetical protein